MRLRGERKVRGERWECEDRREERISEDGGGGRVNTHE